MEWRPDAAHRPAIARIAEVGMGRTGLVAITVAILAAGPLRAEDRIYAVHVSHGQTARLVRSALEGAARRLGQPRCGGLVDRFADAEGRPLRAALESAGVDGSAYLALLIFYDGSRHPRCRRGGIFAVTEVGGQIVWVCPEAFQRLAWNDPGTAEVVVIHEALHSLGLGENPPSSDEINARVRAACRG
jgi:hypothetical protein